MVGSNVLAEFHDSFERCKQDQEFVNKFYELFMSSSAEVKAKFVETDMKRQARILLASLNLIMLSCSPGIDSDIYLGGLAERHSRRALDIEPYHYELWLESLLEAVRQTDPKWDAGVSEAWAAVMQNGIEYMKSRY